MSKQEVLVDTCFFNKLSNNGKNLNVLEKVLREVDYSPVVHPYVAKYELDMFPYFTKLTGDGFVRVADYGEFIQDADDRKFYELYFMDIHNELREYLEAASAKKKLGKLILPDKQTIFTYRKAGMSLGDVHMILMAFFMQIPVVLTEDSDIALLRSIGKRKMASSLYDLNIYNIVDLLVMIARKKGSTFERKELMEIAKNVGEKKGQARIKQEWEQAKNDFPAAFDRI